MAAVTTNEIPVQLALQEVKTMDQTDDLERVAEAYCDAPDEVLTAIDRSTESDRARKRIAALIHDRQVAESELDAARARIAALEAAVKSLHYRMTCVDPAPTWDEIVDTLARARKG